MASEPVANGSHTYWAGMAPTASMRCKTPHHCSRHPHRCSTSFCHRSLHPVCTFSRWLSSSVLLDSSSHLLGRGPVRNNQASSTNHLQAMKAQLQQCLPLLLGALTSSLTVSILIAFLKSELPLSHGSQPDAGVLRAAMHCVVRHR
jgi:hypothetical protein